MARIRVNRLSGLNLKVSPFLHEPGEMIRCINVENDMIGAKKKRPGYATYLGTPDSAQVNSLFSWRQNDGTSFWTYRYSGSVLYYSHQGTGAWTVCGNGTFTNAAYIGHAVLDNTMIAGDGTAATRHTTSGTNFTNTTNAPLAEHYAEYQSRVYAVRGSATSGTATDLIYSNIGTATDWTNDSSSVRLPGIGRPNSLFKAADRLTVTMDEGEMRKYDGYNLVDLATNLGPSSPQSIGEVEDFRFYLNRLGVFGFGGAKPEIISNPIERQIYNDSGSAIVGTVFDNAPGVVHRYDYLISVGTVTDDLTDETIDNAILKYDYQLDEWSNWKFAVRPTAWHSYRDLNGDQQLIFGDGSGQCYTYGGTNLSDNASPIPVAMEGVLSFGAPDLDKKFNYIYAFANPGCQAKMQVAVAETFTKGKKEWIGLGDFSDGVAELRFPSGSEGKLLFWKVTESSMQQRFNFFGFAVDLEMQEEK